jgi:hypothetical protein
LDLTENGDCQTDPLLQGFYLRGGCDTAILAHYARITSSEVEGEYNTVRNDIQLRLDHTLLTRYCIEGLPVEALEAFCRVGYDITDFKSSLFSRRPSGCWVLSFYPDFWVPVFRHNATGLLLPFYFRDVPGILDPTTIPRDERAGLIKNPQVLSAVETLASEFSYAGRIAESDFKGNLRVILSVIPADSIVFIMLAKHFYGELDIPERAARPATCMNQWTGEVSALFPNVELVRVMDFVRNPSEISQDHFQRMVYHRMFLYIRDQARQWIARREIPPPLLGTPSYEVIETPEG